MTEEVAEEIANKLCLKWKETIESISVGSYSRKVESVNSFRMEKYYTGYTQIGFCWKVSFNFGHEKPFDGEKVFLGHIGWKKIDESSNWHKELEIKFTQMFYDGGELSTD